MLLQHGPREHGTGYASECLYMFRLALSRHIYLFLFETPIVTLWSPWAPKHVLSQRVFRGASREFKVRNLTVNGSFCNFCTLALWLDDYISSLHSADEPQEGRNSCPLLRTCFLGSCWCLFTFTFTLLLPSPITIYISIYTLSDLGVLSNLIGSLSLANEHYSPPTE